ncbi:putative BCS1-like ATPase [Aspergillus heteromorphus CBS 117.55]|uniref:Putative BCS1-like ATPase n=1 Tax=Aspergillus heteromorphus CBS 117.55 TaxID=1448321 RepID=A0A317WTJ9_9EURO|nr:putative BCS1-like ATPase [Aspergillus heteromorphus CBS 117.55]PWY89131.1 putative BCS1-like ATPase [Aspergillus heteromorphus CBS 117.55]
MASSTFLSTTNTSAAMNSTSQYMSPTDTALLEAFIPGYSFISRFLISYLHIDLSQYIPYILTGIALVASLRYVFSQARELITKYCVSTAEIRLEDEVYNYLMFWMTQQPSTNKSTQFVANTKITSGARYYDSDDDEDMGDEDDYDSDGNVISNFDDYWAKTVARDKFKRLRFTPREGTHYFWFKGRLLAFAREKEENNNTISYMRFVPERLFISCLGRDPTILKDLLLEAQKAWVTRDGSSTVIYRGQKNSGCTDWTRCMARPPRPLSTVVLDHSQKQSFIADIKEYLHPRTRRWYSNRGIPYRRGYLLHGPPGTGKTSLCFAASGLLGLPLYLLNLSSKSLDEDDLMSLFQELPRRCIVLLEDVDCAGITQKRAPNASDESTPDKPKNSNTPNPQTPGSSKPDDPTIVDKQGITLSGLLNVIDGVAASEGRILIMTTNHPEKLDAALLRPGRVDMSIAFGYAQTADIRELFSSIYSTLEGDLRAVRRNGPKNGTAKTNGAGPAKTSEKHSPSSSSSSCSTPTISARIVKLADDFAALIPAGQFTAAEIQGFLLNHKADPEGAVEGVQGWLEKTEVMRRERVEKAALEEA